MNPEGGVGRPEQAPVRRGPWVYAVVVIAAAVALVPFAGGRLGVHPNLVLVFLVLMPAADLLTGYLLAQQFLAHGRPTTLTLAGIYLFSSLVMTAYAVAFTRSQASGAGPSWSEVRAPLLGWVVVAGFPVLVAAVPARRHDLARGRRPAAVAIMAVAAVASAATVAGAVAGGSAGLPPLYQNGSATAAGRVLYGVAVPVIAVSLLAVARDLRRRPEVERWVVVAISASLATAVLTLVAPRYSVGFYAARTALLVSSAVVLTALIAETAGLYRRLSAAHDELHSAHRELSRRAEHLTTANRELEAADVWKSDILAALSHEINQPLAVISACAEELSHDWDSITDDERRTSAETLGRRVDDLLDMAAHLLALCRAERGDIRTRPAVLPVDRMLTRLVDNLSRQARQRVDADFGPPGAAVWADPVHTHQVLINFVTNAVKYSPGAVHVSATLNDTGTMVLFAVSDEGNGVPPDFVAHLFDRFTQADGAGAARTGAGFGLYLSRLLTEANHGALWYEAVVPHGSRFVLALPSAPGGAPAMARLAHADGAVTGRAE
ncbi:hypothetical protein Aph02nite_46260 [Actinoplanes philippinensis]|uniref:sensor histidine kinase n=1 Tax=Actinoplanes philippinensis TaxID=35752 RepID=UPI0015A6687F|nr:HAMP domain-containing sensor histidine kinase [Actinoplanes philippinensis]GIE78676.1 hypothetical protein Aph02nite_46260 [Actinoplanes philippinensis]